MGDYRILAWAELVFCLLLFAIPPLGVHCAAAKPEVVTSAAAAQIQIDIRGTADPHDDYIAWSPVPATIRQAPGGTRDIAIVLTNQDVATPNHGQVNFAADAAAYKQAIDSGSDPSALKLTLPASGAAQSFVVAGRFPHFSLQDHDTIIAVHEGGATGRIIAAKTLMVRVRRNLETLTQGEMDRFLWALAALRFRKAAGGNPGESVYDFLVRMHDIGAKGYDLSDPHDLSKGYPDQEHKGAGFLPWHRAFLLELERQLQSVDPSVALPYWPIYQKPAGAHSRVFDAAFTGGNSVASDQRFYVPEPTRFAAGNPLYGWYMKDRGPLARWTLARDNPNFTKPGNLIDRDHGGSMKDKYIFAAGAIESNPHNIGHNWSGVWMSNCKISPSDPLFWPFHTYFDWLWAAWQQNYDRFATDGSDPANYWPNGTYEAGSAASKQNAKGHHLKDTMWPWDGDTTQSKDFGARRPPVVVGGKFAASTVPGLWPGADATPTPGNMIDYAGYASRADDEGVGYDSIPWSPKQALPPFPGDIASAPDALATFLDTKRSVQDRLAALKQIDLEQATAAVDKVQAVAAYTRSPTPLRIAALELLRSINTTKAVAAAIRIARVPLEPELATAVDETLKTAMFSGSSGDPASALGARLMANPVTIRILPSADDPAQRAKLYASMRNLAPDNAPQLLAAMAAQLADFVEHPTGERDFPPQDAIGLIVSTNLLLGGPAAMHDGMPGMKAATPDLQKALAAMRAILRMPHVDGAQVDWPLAEQRAAAALYADTDRATPGLLADIARDTRRLTAVRSAALNALRHLHPERFENTALAIAGNAAETDAMRSEALAAIGAFAFDQADAGQGGKLGPLQKKVGDLTPNLPAGVKPAALAARKLLALALK